MSTILNFLINSRQRAGGWGGGYRTHSGLGACLFCLRQAGEFETGAHALSFLRGPSHPSGGCGTCMKGRSSRERGVHFHPLSFGRFPNIPSHTPQQHHHLPLPLLLVSLPIPPTVSSAFSSPLVSFLQTHFACLPSSPSHSYDLGVRVAPTPSPPATPPSSPMDHVTLPLLSRSPCEGAPCQA